MIKINTIFLIAVGLSIIFALLVGGYVPCGIFYSLISILFMGYIYIAVLRRSIDGEVVFHDKVVTAGSSGECLTIIKGSSLFPVPYAVASGGIFMNSLSGYPGEVLNITTKENAWIRKEIKFVRRGIYSLGKIEVNIRDLFGIFQCKTMIDCKVDVKVYPKIWKVKNLPYGGKDIYQETLDFHGTNEDMFSIRDIRKYRSGDSMKRVHWKASARHGELYVREADSISGEEYILFLDMQSRNRELDRDGSIEEENVDACVSIVKYMQSKGINTRVFINASKPVKFYIDSMQAYENFLEFLLTQDSDGESEFTGILYDNFFKLQRTDRIAVITPKVDSSLTDCVSTIKGSGYNVTVFYIIPDDDSLKYSAMLSKNGVKCVLFRNMVDGNQAGGQ